MFETIDARFIPALLSSDPFYHQLAQATATDPTFVRLHGMLTKSGGDGSQIHKDAASGPLWPMRHYLRAISSFLVMQDQLCVPHTLRATALRILHQGHPGTTLMQERALNLFFWPRIMRHVYEHVLGCHQCSIHVNHRPREPLVSTPVPQHPGEQVACDYFQFQSRRFLVFYDVFSNFPFLCPVSSEGATELLHQARIIFLQTGLSRIFASDNGGAFISSEFQRFLQAQGVTFRPSSP